MRLLAFEILIRVEKQGAYASVLLEHAEAGLSPRDGALLHELVLGVLRHRTLLDHVLSRVASRPLTEVDLEARTAIRLGAYSLLFLDRIPAFAAVGTSVDLVRSGRGARSTGFVNAVLRRIGERGTSLLPGEPERGDVAALATLTSHPGWWVDRIVRRLGWEEARRLLDADNARVATVLRPNSRRITPGELALRLEEEGVKTEPCRYVPEALRVLSGRAQHAQSFRDGYAWIQDEASQLVTHLLGRQLGPRVADLCAAPGTKTLCLADRMAVGSVLVAVDRNPARLRSLLDNLRRLSVTDVFPVAADLTRNALSPGAFEHVQVDAPCSGTGTLRRHPEIRWRLTHERIGALAKRQGVLLDQAARLCAPGGLLLYSVCSLEPEEGEEVVASFLARQPGFERARAEPNLPEPARRFLGADGCLRTSPALEGLDGFFAALLSRRSAR